MGKSYLHETHVVMVHQGGLPMHDTAGRPNDLPTEGLAYALVPHADPKHWNARPQALHYLQ